MMCSKGCVESFTIFIYAVTKSVCTQIVESTFHLKMLFYIFIEQMRLSTVSQQNLFKNCHPNLVLSNSLVVGFQ